VLGGFQVIQGNGLDAGFLEEEVEQGFHRMLSGKKKATSYGGFRLDKTQIRTGL
jgi:hypothetical protein